MSAEHGKSKERFISKEASREIKIGGVIAGVIGLIAEIATLGVAGFGVAGGAVVYDVYRRRKEKKLQKKAHH